MRVAERLATPAGPQSAWQNQMVQTGQVLPLPTLSHWFSLLLRQKAMLPIDMPAMVVIKRQQRH